MNSTSNSVKMSGLSTEVQHAFGDNLFASVQDCGLTLPEDLGDNLYCTFRVGDSENELAQLNIESELHEKVINNRAVLLKGAAGVGKTTLLRYYFARYRNSRFKTDLPNDLIMWVNMKNQIGADIETRFYSDLRTQLEHRFGESFALRREMWQRYIKTKIGEDALRDARVQGVDAENALVTQKILTWCESDKEVVDEFVNHWKGASPDSRFFLVVDNLDTMSISLRQPALQFALEQIDKPTRLGFAIDCLILAVRPETVKKYKVGRQLETKAALQDVPPVDLRKGLAQRAAFVREQLWSKRGHLQSIISVTIPDNVDRTSSKWFKGPAPKVGASYLMMNTESSARALGVFRILERAINDVFDTSIAVSDVIEKGARNENVWSIFRNLCGRSMRRAVEICRSIMVSEGILRDAADNGKLRPYVFLDALVERALYGEGAYISNVYKVGSGLADASFVTFLPVLLFMLSDFCSQRVERNQRFDLWLDKSDLFKRMQCVGFSEGVIRLGLGEACTNRLLVPVHDDQNEVAGYVINRNLVAAHVKLMCEPAYIDNVAQDYSYKPAMGRRISGFKSSDFVQRIENTLEFIEWIKQSEIDWFQRLSGSERSEIARMAVPSFSYSIAWNYADRLNGIDKSSAPRESVQTIRTSLQAIFRSFRLNDRSLNEQFKPLLLSDLM